MTRGQRVLLWSVTTGALTIGLLLPIYSGATDSWLLLDPRRPQPRIEEKFMWGISRWPDRFVSNATYPLSTLVGIIAAYMALRRSSTP